MQSDDEYEVTQARSPGLAPSFHDYRVQSPLPIADAGASRSVHLQTSSWQASERDRESPNAKIRLDGAHAPGSRAGWWIGERHTLPASLCFH